MKYSNTPVVMAPAYKLIDVYFIFRNNGEEVEINVEKKSSTHQLTFNEIGFINENYPFIKVEQFKLIQKTFT